MAERYNRTLTFPFKKTAFEEGSAAWISELLSVIKQYNNSIHNSTKLIPIAASKRLNEKVVFDNLEEK